jgi:hypothetical protein
VPTLAHALAATMNAAEHLPADVAATFTAH